MFEGDEKGTVYCVEPLTALEAVSFMYEGKKCIMLRFNKEKVYMIGETDIVPMWDAIERAVQSEMKNSMVIEKFDQKH